MPFEDMRQALQTEVSALQENDLWIIAESLTHLPTPVSGIWEIHPFVILKNLYRPQWLKKQLRRLPAFTREIFAS